MRLTTSTAAGALLLATTGIQADIVMENELIISNEVFDLNYAMDSEVEAVRQRNETQFYCIFRSKWTVEDHPEHFPKLARFSTPVLFSHTKQYTPFLKNREANYGIEIIAEEGFTSKMQEQLDQAGDMVLDYGEARGFYLNRKHYDLNIAYFPPVVVTDDHPYLSGIAGFDPSPDWFTGFYMMDTRDEYSGKFWSHFKVQSYPWDAGTDGGTIYEDVDHELEFPEPVHRITPENAQNKIFVSPMGDEVLPVAEFECILHVCPAEEPGCRKPDWPPKNGCDVLLYPECDNYCDPEVDEVCERCVRESILDPEILYYPDCCAAGREPKTGKDCAGRRSGATSLCVGNVVSWIFLSSWIAFWMM
ncbi:hypothetical protein FisN_14Lh007 [Fistulifera solaris]|uniref:Spondin domain-containing protein n=1 Tax=Fistulifera solaris TaxID=1519565 RepID=A0A1Z5KHG0_FISSO|nr:hypothetical protein FisN_14Lh007 [Fistulifera solaris]|eukprot:GAX25699.1 hypothetical protein FisN_14Lh007 [Fistulifera solaris]